MPSPTDPDLPPLLVLAPDDPLAPQIGMHLAALFPGEGLARFADLQAAVSAGGEAAILLPLIHPAEAIARHLAMTGRVDDALAAWKAEAEPMLVAARRVRRRLRLVDARALAQGEAQVLSQLTASGGTAVATEMPTPVDSVLLVIAEAALLRDPEALRLADEIAALRRGGEGGALSAEECQAALDVYLLANAAQQTVARLQEEGAALEAKATAQETEVGLLREALALQVADRRRADEAREAMLADLPGRAQDQPAATQDTIADLTLQTAKVQALQHQLDLAAEQAELREAVLAAILLKDQQGLLAGAATHARAEGLEQELHSVYASKSWRVTGPLRALRARA